MKSRNPRSVFWLLLLCVMSISPWVYSDCPMGDLSGDCIVNLSDLELFAENWLGSMLLVHSGVVAHWTLDETMGENAADEIGGYTGWLHGEPQWMTGALKGALSFDGTDDFVEALGFKGILGGSSRTCSAWINTKFVSKEILSWGEPSNGGKWVIRVNEGGQLRAEIHSGYIVGTTLINDGEWHHIAVSFNNDGTPMLSEASLYVDGKSEPFSAVSDRAVNTVSGQDVRLGVFGADLRYFNGLIDDVQIYDCALAADEIMLLYTRGTSLRHSPDFNADNQVNIQDYAVISADWDRQEPPVIISEFVAANDSDTPPDTAAGQILDGNGEASDWIELFNQTDSPINLAGWGLSDKQTKPLKWKFPANTIINGRSYLIVFASSKADNYVDPKGYLHTSFSLSASGEYLGLALANGTAVSTFTSVLNPDTGDYGFPAQEDNISYGQLGDGEYYFALPTPGKANQQSFLGFVDAPSFSHERGYYDTTFSLTLSTATSDAVIRYTTNGTDPTLTNGTVYVAPITVTVPTSSSSRVVRAAAFKTGYRSSKIITKTYLLRSSSTMKGLPAVCLSGSPTGVFYNPNGIMAIVGGTWSGGVWQKLLTTDYNNLLSDLERPVSMEYMRPTEAFEFQEDCGIRSHGSAYMRPRYTPPPQTGMWGGTNKISLRLYFRSLYGETAFNHSILDEFPEVDKIDKIVLRAGHNDETNPFIRDEMMRRLHCYMGHYGSRGGFVNLFINGDYKGYYNLCERIDEDYCQQWFNSDQKWDIVGWIQPDNVLEVRDGDDIAFNTFIDYASNNNLSNYVYYNEVIRQLDLERFIDYIMVQTWGGNWDWPQNNWAAAGERSANRKWMFFVWDGEGCMDGNTSQNRFSTLNSDGTSLSRLYRALYTNEDFRVMFCDRLQKHFLENDGALSKPYLNSVFRQLESEVKGVIPSMDQFIPLTYIPARQDIYFSQCLSQSLFTFAGPRFLVGGRDVSRDHTAENFQLTLQNASGVTGDVYYTLDGSDPRLGLDQRVSITVLVPENAAKKVLIPTTNIGTTWRTSVTYDDSAWTDGVDVGGRTGGVGYEINTTETTALPYISYDVKDKMYSKRTSAYIRIPFTVTNQQRSDWNTMTLKMRYDDGFVVYLNGTEVYRKNLSGTLAYNSKASVDRENNSIESFSLNNYLNLLRDGENLLAIQGLNYSTTNSDFVISAVLEAGFLANTQGVSPRAQKYTAPLTLSKSAQLKARTLNGSKWSALRQAMICVGPISDNLRISEVMYHPADPNEEFVELVNQGAAAINLYGVSFDKGISFTFPDTVLGAGQRLLVVRNRAVFESRYGTGLPVAGQYEGALDDAGETLRLCDITGVPIQELDYHDGWYEIADGDGFSLTAADPTSGNTVESEQDLDARWTFNETAGTAVLDSTGSYPGTIMNMADTTRQAGVENKALAFDGVDDYVAIPSYKGVAGKGARTCSAWVKTSVIGQILTWGVSETGKKWVIRISENGALRAEVQGGSIVGTTVLTDNQWHHVAVALANDGSPDITEARLYVDGHLETISSSQACLMNTSNVQSAAIGTYLSSPMYYQGLLDDVRVYSHALTSQEISQLMAGVLWKEELLWKPSAIRGGTPGRGETAQEALPLPGAVVLNEILSHSHSDLPDWIELYNTTSQNINIGGWFVSNSFDSDPNRKKFQIPSGVILTPSNPYYVISESQFNNRGNSGCRIPFALSEGGDTVYLQSAAGEQLTGYFTKQSFGAAESNVSFGRFTKTLGGTDFVAMREQTEGKPNVYPKVGPVIITEIMYNPGTAENSQDYEYLELMNISGSPVRTASLVDTYTSENNSFEEWVAWKFTEGIEYEFPSNLILQPGQRMLLVNNKQAFETYFTGVPAGTVVVQWQLGKLANEGEAIELSMPGDKEYLKDRFYIREDKVSYNNAGNWPSQADGTGKSLIHISPTLEFGNYTDDSTHWTAGSPTPGW